MRAWLGLEHGKLSGAGKLAKSSVPSAPKGRGCQQESKAQGRVDLVCSGTVHAPAGRVDHLWRSPAERKWAALVSGARAGQEQGSGLFGVRSLSLLPALSPSPLPSPGCDQLCTRLPPHRGDSSQGSRAPQLAPHVPACQAQVVRRLYDQK